MTERRLLAKALIIAGVIILSLFVGFALACAQEPYPPPAETLAAYPPPIAPAPATPTPRPLVTGIQDPTGLTLMGFSARSGFDWSLNEATIIRLAAVMFIIFIFKLIEKAL